jgi:hypothetical protein
MLLFIPIFSAMLCNVDGQNRHLVTVNTIHGFFYFPDPSQETGW